MNQRVIVPSSSDLVAGAACHRQRWIAQEAWLALGARAAPERAAARAALRARVATARAEPRRALGRRPVVRSAAPRLVHANNLHSRGVRRRSTIRSRLERVLALCERWLEERVGETPSPEWFAAHTAFRWEREGGPGRLRPVTPAPFDLDELVGVERPLAELLRNTEQFLRGLPAQHVLLYGERGTGKSSAVRGLLTRFASRGLRVVEVRKAELAELPRILAALRGAPQRFLLFCDDLSFDEGEPGYRELKAALEGGLEPPPANVRLLATSNRRHLIPELRSENQAVRLDEDGELQLGEALEEKLALADRFGLALGFFGFDQRTYLAIVERMVRRAGLGVEVSALERDALRWALSRSSRSGRTARQFVDDLAGRLALEAGR
jgi:predicted AAA+ superfamily ATPase